MRGWLSAFLAALVISSPITAQAGGPTRASLQPQIIAGWGPMGVAVARLHSGSMALAFPVLLAGGFTSPGGGFAAGSGASGNVDNITPTDGTVTVTGAIAASTSITAGSTNFFFSSGAGGGISNSNNSLYAYGNVADGASAVGVILNNGVTLANAGSKIVSIRNNGSEKAYFDLNGALSLGQITIANVAAPTRIQSTGGALVLQGGTPGNVTIQEPGTAGVIASFVDNGGAGEMLHGFGNGSAGLVYAGGSLSTNTTAVGNVGASGPDDLISYTLPADSLFANGRGFRWKAWGTITNNANAKTMICVYGGQTVLTHAMTVSIAGTWNAEGTVVRTGVDTQDWNSVYIGNTGAANVFEYDPEVGTGAVDDGGTIAVKCQTTVSTTNNDVVQEGAWVQAF